MTNSFLARPFLRVFLDSSGFLALVNPRDIYHAQAQASWSLVLTRRARTFTTNFVVAETHALFLARLSHRHAVGFLRGIYESATTAVRVTAVDERRAAEIIVQYTDKNFSLTDALSFAVMERLRILTVLTYDRDFVQYGFIQLSG